jgi:hypothetical protein
MKPGDVFYWPIEEGVFKLTYCRTDQFGDHEFEIDPPVLGTTRGCFDLRRIFSEEIWNSPLMKALR